MRRALLTLIVLTATLHASSDELFHLRANYNAIASTRVSRPGHRHSRLQFQEGLALATYKQQLTQTEALTYGVGYLGDRFHFNRHSLFRQQRFNNLLLQLGGITTDKQHWRWEADVLFQMDTSHLSLSRYTVFWGNLHGIYDWNERSHLHVGLMGLTGTHYTHVLPVLGADYKLSDAWLFRFVFPYDASITYTWHRDWSLVAAARPFFVRQRMGTDEPSHMRRGLLAYRNIGGELGVRYTIGEHGFFNVHVGQTFWGKLRVSNRYGHDTKHYRVHSAPFIGAIIGLNF